MPDYLLECPELNILYNSSSLELAHLSLKLVPKETPLGNQFHQALGSPYLLLS